MKIKIIHFITALEGGGAEKILFDTISGLRGQFNHQVVVLSKRGAYCKKIEDIDISVEKISIRLLWKLLLSERNRYLIHSYLYHSHIVSLLFKLIGYHVIWSIHSSIINTEDFKIKLVSWLSYLVPNKIIYVSDFARNQHTQIGFTKQKSIVVYNGLDVNKFNNKNQCALAIDKSHTCIAMIARYHPNKDYSKFSSIASIALKLNPSCYFYLIGKGNNKSNKELFDLLEKHQLLDNVKLMGEVDDIAAILPCFDLLVSTSKSESFGLTIVEAILSNVNVSTINLPIMDELFEHCSPNMGELKDEDSAKIWLERSKEKPNDALIQYANNYSLDQMIKSYKGIYRDYLK
jgi:glycosyltransferase involved in cell wall biosynthesis